MMKKRVMVISLIAVLILSGCSLPGRQESDQQSYDGYIYYLNDEHTDLVREGYMFDSKTGQTLADDIVARLAINADDTHDSPLPDGVVIDQAVVAEHQVQVHLNALFDKATETEKTLCRAALVLSFTQIPDVRGVLFFVDDQPMADAAGNALDAQKASDYLYSTSSYPEPPGKRTLNLYYGDAAGEKLKKESVTVRTNGEKQIVCIIAERLIAGPAFEEESALIPQNTRVINAALIGDTAYINFDDGMADTNIKVSSELCIYSIVNSVIENTSATQVKIQIEGRSPANYGGQIDLSQPLEARKSLAK